MTCSHIFSTLNLVTGYYQVEKFLNDIPKTAIITPFGLFKFVRMPFGLRNAGSTFQRMIDRVLAGLPPQRVKSHCPRTNTPFHHFILTEFEGAKRLNFLPKPPGVELSNNLCPIIINKDYGTPCITLSRRTKGHPI